LNLAEYRRRPVVSTFTTSGTARSDPMVSTYSCVDTIVSATITQSKTVQTVRLR
jgi:hypothetical protein